MTTENNDDLARRNLVTEWHLAQGMPDCGCDDETADADLCPESIAWAGEQMAGREDSSLDGPADPWDHNIWVAAWGRNAPLVVSDNDFRIPNPPAGMTWLLTRMLVRGRKVIDIALVRLSENNLMTVARRRVVPDQEAVTDRARVMLQEVL